MDLQSDDNRYSPWDFKAVRQFLDSFHAFSPDVTPAELSTLDPESYNSKSQAPKTLGDFDRLFDFCGKPLTTPRRRSDDSSSARYEGTSTPVSSAPDDEVTHFEDFVKGKEVRWRDQEGSDEIASYRARSTRSSRAEDLDTSVQLYLPRVSDLKGLEFHAEDQKNDPSSRSGFSLEAVVQSPRKRQDKTKHQSSSHLLSTSVSSLLPASVTPSKRNSGPLPHPPFRNANEFLDPNVIKPHYTLTANEQKAKLIEKLARRFIHEAKLLQSPETIVRKGGNIHSSGIHVFVDLSNIVIGFIERIKINRIQAGRLGPRAYVKQPPFSFHSLSLVLERGRTVGRRVMVGSTSNILYDPKGQPVPEHVREAERLGYEGNILERVAKPQKINTPRKKKRGSGSGYATSGYSSASEPQATGPLKMQEQAVDELLQMKMLESLVDSQPSTIVLASGDAAEAEYSGGFLRTVERALTRGWKVEIAAWSKGLSNEYRSKELLTKWGDKLTIIELDEFGEEMLGIYTHKFEL